MKPCIVIEVIAHFLFRLRPQLKDYATHIQVVFLFFVFFS